jgi:hypothetical protein
VPIPRKTCQICKEEYQPTNNSQKRCPKCGAVAKRAYRKEWQRAHKVKKDKHRFCQVCGREYLPTSPRQKYCPECRVSIHCARVCAYEKRNPEIASAHNLKYRKAHPEKAYMWRKNNPDKFKIISDRYVAKRRDFGYVRLNSWFPDCEGHHIDKEHVVYLPKELHRSIWHNLRTGKNMEQINALAQQFCPFANDCEESGAW